MNEELIELITDEEIDISVDEGMGWTVTNSTMHDSLSGRDFPNQHPIKSIIGLKEQIDGIKTLKTAHSNGYNVANYYAWGRAPGHIGRFVSLQGSAIVLCDGQTPIFGVTVDDAGFIGGQSEIVSGEDEYGVPNHIHTRNDAYALVVASGLVDVQCASDIVVGDFVVSGTDGVAVTTTSQCGYKVVAIGSKDNIPYASIALGVQADVTDWLGQKAAHTDAQFKDVEASITAVRNTATLAYNKAVATADLNQNISDKVDNALGMVDKNEQNVESAVNASEEAKKIAENANINCTLSMEAANDAWAKSEHLKEEEYSLRAHIDDYSVGEYSQAYGLTLEQATGILPYGIIYAPVQEGATETYKHTETYRYTNHIESVTEFNSSSADPTKVYCVTTTETETEIETETGKETNKEVKKYYYYESQGWQKSDSIPTYSRDFTAGFLYQWRDLDNGRRGWVTVDKNHKPEVAPNIVTEAVNITNQEFPITDGYGYWYTDGDKILDINGNPGVYSRHTLYRWEKIAEDGPCAWVAKATSAGNVNNRIMSATTLDTNEALFELYNARGGAASIGARLTETEATANLVTRWAKGGNESGSTMYNLAAVESSADGDGSSLALVVADQEGNKILNGASLVLSQGENESRIQLDARNIIINGEATFTTTENGQTKIDGSHISTKSLDASFIDVDDLTARIANVGGWRIDGSSISKGSALLAAGSETATSLIDGNPPSPIRISAGIGQDQLIACTYEGTIVPMIKPEYDDGDGVLTDGTVRTIYSEYVDSGDAQYDKMHDGKYDFTHYGYRANNNGVMTLVLYKSDEEYPEPDHGSPFFYEGRVTVGDDAIECDKWRKIETDLDGDAMAYTWDSDYKQYAYTNPIVRNDGFLTFQYDTGYPYITNVDAHTSYCFTDDNVQINVADGISWHEGVITVNLQVEDFNESYYGEKYYVDIDYIQLKDAPFQVLEDGSLYANNAKIKGVIEATDGEFSGKIISEDGEIGGWTIDKNVIKNDGLYLCSGDEYKADSIAWPGEQSAIRLLAGIDEEEHEQIEDYTVKLYYKSSDNSMWFEHAIDAPDGYVFTNVHIDLQDNGMTTMRESTVTPAIPRSFTAALMRSVIWSSKSVVTIRRASFTFAKIVFITAPYFFLVVRSAFSGISFFSMIGSAAFSKKSLAASLTSTSTVPESAFTLTGLVIFSFIFPCRLI